MNRAFLLAAAVSTLLLAGCEDSSSPTSTSSAPQAEPDRGVINEAANWGKDAKGEVDPKALLDNNWYIVLDGSGSMRSPDCSSGKRGGRIVDAKDALQRFVSKLPENDNVGLFVFDNNGRGQKVALGQGPANRAAIRVAIKAVEAGDGTPLVPAIQSAYDALKAEAVKQSGYGSYHIVVETDGEPNEPVGEAGGMRALGQKVLDVTKSPIVLETIGFCIAEGHPLNSPGRTVYRNAMSARDLDRGLEAILAETDAFADDNTGVK